MTTSQEQRHIFYDSCLGIEAYQLSGIVQKFPNHFHECYVVGFIEGGCRHLWCRGSEYDLSKGDLILFNPKDNHFCSPMNGELLDYRALNIPVPVMKRAAADITGREFIPQFTVNVVYHSDITTSLADVYNAIVTGASPFEKEEAFFFLLEQILKEHSAPYEEHNGVFLDSAIADTCEYLKEHYSENITLEELTDLGVRNVMTCFDMDYLKNWHVESAYTNLVQMLGRLPLSFGTYLWAPDHNGLDDFIWEFCLKKQPLG